MLIYAMISWPDIVSEQLWPFALQLAVNLHNDTHGPSGLSPLEIFSGVKSLSNKLCDFHPFGSLSSFQTHHYNKVTRFPIGSLVVV
jgi:hypothetical protein